MARRRFGVHNARGLPPTSWQALLSRCSRPFASTASSTIVASIGCFEAIVSLCSIGRQFDRLNDRRHAGKASVHQIGPHPFQLLILQLRVWVGREPSNRS
jgi:hypothetical protein